MPKNCPFPILDGSVEFTYLCKYMHIYCPFLIQEPRTMDHGVLWRGKVCVHVFQSGAGSSTGPPAWCCLQRYTKLYGICTGYRQDLIGHWTRILGCYILYILLVKETRVIVYFKIPLVDHRDCLGLRWWWLLPGFVVQGFSQTRDTRRSWKGLQYPTTTRGFK